jgi:hypothetical protein
MYVLLIIVLIAAGIFTHAAIWYLLAAVLGGFWLLVSLVALAGAGAVLKKVNKDFKDFDKGFESDFFKKHRR